MIKEAQESSPEPSTLDDSLTMEVHRSGGGLDAHEVNKRQAEAQRALGVPAHDHSEDKAEEGLGPWTDRTTGVWIRPQTSKKRHTPGPSLMAE